MILILIYNRIYKPINDLPILVMNNSTPLHFLMDFAMWISLDVLRIVVMGQRFCALMLSGAQRRTFIRGEYLAA